VKFRHLSAGERGMFWVAVILTICCNAVALIVGYSLALHFVESVGVFDPKLAKLFPVLGDTVLLVAEVALIYLWMMRQRVADPSAINRGPVIAVMAVAFTVMLAAVEMRAGHSWGARLLVASAPLLAFGLFQVLLSLIKATLLALGRIGTETTVISGVPEVASSYPAGDTPQNRQMDLARGSSVPKVEFARQLCRTKSPELLAKTNGSYLAEELQGLGVDIAPSEAWRALLEVRAERASSNGRKR